MNKPSICPVCSKVLTESEYKRALAVLEEKPEICSRTDKTDAPASERHTITLPMKLQDLEIRAILAALDATNWHRAKAAEILGVSLGTVYRRVRDYKLKRFQKSDPRKSR